MKKFIPLLVLIFLCSCSSSKQGNSVEYSMELVKSKKVTLPIDENTYYLSRRMFQYEEEGKELLFFCSFEKSAYEIILFDSISRKIVLSRAIRHELYILDNRTRHLPQLMFDQTSKHIPIPCYRHRQHWFWNNNVHIRPIFP